jgi:nitroreductase
LDNLRKQVEKHEKILNVLLDSKRTDEEKFREQHHELETKISDLENRFKSLKKDIFKMIENIDELHNDTLRIIYGRRAVRQYKSNPVDKKLIIKIIEAGKMAPSAINKQPWKFYVLTDKNEIKSFSDVIVKTAKPHFHLAHGVNVSGTIDPIFYGAPVVIYITIPKNDKWGLLDAGLCAQNLMLAAKSVGLDSCPVGFARFIEQTPLYPKLNIPESEEIALAVILGYGNENPPVHDRVKDNLIFL